MASGYRKRAVPSRAACQSGIGGIWNGIRFEIAVIPAKAGIQSVDGAFPTVYGVDSRFRGNDCGLERPCSANDTTTAGGERVVVNAHWF